MDPETQACIGITITYSSIIYIQLIWCAWLAHDSLELGGSFVYSQVIFGRVSIMKEGKVIF